jgi:imidazolonepropionase
MTLACSTLHLSPEEAFTAATWNAAWATGLGGKAGGLSPGFWADAVIFDADDYREVAYRFGTSLVRTVVKGGRVVVRDGELTGDRYTPRTK